MPDEAHSATSADPSSRQGALDLGPLPGGRGREAHRRRGLGARRLQRRKNRNEHRRQDDTYQRNSETADIDLSIHHTESHTSVLDRWKILDNLRRLVAGFLRMARVMTCLSIHNPTAFPELSPLPPPPCRYTMSGQDFELL